MSFSETIDRLSSITYDYFCINYMKLNKPCIFTSNLTDSWKSRREWVTDKGNINVPYLVQNFGHSNVPVVSCDESNKNCDHEEMLLKTYAEQYLVDNAKSNSEKLLYLKDWHFKREYTEYDAYETLKYFKDDWLNEFCENEKDDFKFVYIGPKGTRTQFHADVYGSYSWSANVCGRKRWILFPPGQEKILKNNTNKIYGMVKEQELINNNITFIDVIQEAGEVIFVPSGWYHQVWNIENTISINHNWFNRYNILHIWNCLRQASLEVENELSDLKGCEDWWSDHQFLLKAHHGMNLYEFLKILESIYILRTNTLKSTDINLTDNLLDLEAIKNVCTKIINFSSMPEELLLQINKLYLNIIDFMQKIENTNL